MRKLFSIVLILSLFSFVGAQDVSAWKGFVAGQSDADVTETEAEALQVIGDANDGITAAQADGLFNVAQGELTDTEVGYLNGATTANSVASKVAVINSGTDLDLADDLTMSSASPQITMVDTDTDVTANGDSAAVVIESNGEPSIAFYATDGDAGNLSIDTNDQFTINSFAATVIDSDLDIGDDLTLSSATPEIIAVDTDVDVTANGDSAAVKISASAVPRVHFFEPDGSQWIFEIISDTLCIAQVGVDTLRLHPTR